MEKIKVAVSSIFYPVHMGMYFVRALQRREDVELWTTGPYTGGAIPWTDPNSGQTLYMPAKYVFPPDNPLPSSLTRTLVPFSSVRSKMPWTPDLFLMLDAGWHFIDRPDGKIVARVQTDPHVLKGFYKHNKPDIDVEFVMQGPYIEEGEDYLPYAYDPTLYYPMPEVEKEYDACLIGLHYPQRDQLVNRLRSRGLKVHYSIGEIFDDYRIAYNKAKIALSWSTLDDLPCRVFEAFGMKVPLVTNRVPDLKRFFVEDEHYFGFSTLAEGEAKVMLALSDYENAKRVAQNVYDVVKEDHVWDKRVTQILETCKLL